MAGLPGFSGHSKSPSHHKVKAKFKLDSKPGVYSQVSTSFGLAYKYSKYVDVEKNIDEH